MRPSFYFFWTLYYFWRIQTSSLILYLCFLLYLYLYQSGDLAGALYYFLFEIDFDISLFNLVVRRPQQSRLGMLK